MHPSALKQLHPGAEQPHASQELIRAGAERGSELPWLKGAPPPKRLRQRRFRSPRRGSQDRVLSRASLSPSPSFVHFTSAARVLIPITLAVLLSFVLAPLMELLRRFWLPRVVAALVAVLIAIGVMIILGGFIGTQIAGLAEQVPQYQTTIETKVGSLRKLIATDLSNRISGWTHKIEGTVLPKQGTLTPQRRGPGTLGQPGGAEPVPVVITQTAASSALEISQRILQPVIGPIADLGIILVVAIFTLLQKADLRDRLIRLFGSDDLHRTTAAMSDAGRRLTRYFLTQLGINFSFGVIVGVGLYLLGVPSPVLWGILGALLRFVPYIGSYIAAALPILLAAAPCSSARRRPAAS